MNHGVLSLLLIVLPNGYRLYTEEHVAYFECIRAMNEGFGMDLVRKIMPLIQERKIDRSTLDSE